MAQETTNIFENLSYYCDSDSTPSEISSIQSSEGDFAEMSECDEFVVSDGEHSAYTEGSSFYDNNPFENPDSEQDGISENEEFISVAMYHT
ncbi:hypothetical protein PENSUB_5305 [Penicillium subrubescens]|uniref:Uncharacterized protein n=1 Tax=Penicillium subrubescens TaxID=1316194 RepID=A0A1Q5UA51_9EURO|nr:hypothetical protein PENSUB_5305 [Penicillium subrubescens]